MSMILETTRRHIDGRRIYRVKEDCVAFGMAIPGGFETDAGSIPWFGRWLISPVGPPMEAYVVHDFMLENEYGWITSNEVFNQNLKNCNIPDWKRAIIMAAVEFRAWQQNYEYVTHPK